MGNAGGCLRSSIRETPKRPLSKRSSMGNAGGCLRSSIRETPKIPLSKIVDEGNPLKEKQEPAQGKKDVQETSMAQQIYTDENIGDIGVFPEEIILEILSWLPVKSLARLKCVCKKCYRLIEDRQFIKKNISRASTSMLKNIYNTQTITPVTNPISNIESFQFICGCDGLLVRKNNASGKYLIRNPTTQQKLDLPSPDNGSFGMTMSYISATGYYKLFSCIKNKGEWDDGRCEILTIGIDDSWRSLKVPNLFDEDKAVKKIFSVSAGEAVHFVRVIKAGSYIFGEEVVSLDLNTERFTTTSVPKYMLSDWGSIWAIDWNGHLALADRVGNDLNVLVLEDYKKHAWGERKKMLHLALAEERGDVKDLVPLYSRCGSLWFRLDDRKFICYNIESGKIVGTISPTNGSSKIVGSSYIYPPSLVSLKGMKPEK